MSSAHYRTSASLCSATTNGDGWLCVCEKEVWESNRWTERGYENWELVTTEDFKRFPGGQKHLSRCQSGWRDQWLSMTASVRKMLHLKFQIHGMIFLPIFKYSSRLELYFHCAAVLGRFSGTTQQHIGQSSNAPPGSFCPFKANYFTTLLPWNCQMIRNDPWPLQPPPSPTWHRPHNWHDSKDKESFLAQTWARYLSGEYLIANV